MPLPTLAFIVVWRRERHLVQARYGCYRRRHDSFAPSQGFGVVSPRSKSSARLAGPRVAHIATTDASLRILLMNQMQTLRSAGFDVAGISSAGNDVGALEEGGIHHFAIPMSRRYTPVADLRALLALWRLLRREGFEVVHTHTPKAGLLGQYASLLAGVPLRVHTIHGLYLPGNMRKGTRFLYVLLERITMAFSHHNFSQNPEDIAVAIDEKISRPERLEFIGNGIDLIAFSPDRQPPEKRSATRAALGLTDDHLVVGMVARLVAEKGYFEMFEAAKAIRAVEPRARFIFIGGFEPQKADAIQRGTLEQYGIADIAQFLGHRTDMPDLYAAMDVHVLASHREGFPRSPMEASTMGLASIVTDVRGCRQTVDDGKTGLVVPARNPERLAASILDLLRDPEKRRRFGKAAREKAHREFDEQVVFRKVRDAYVRLLTRAGRSQVTPSTVV